MIDKKYVDLYKEARRAYENAYAPYSHFKVGAAILTKEGKSYIGVNVENSSYGATICAERSALTAAVTCGEREFDAIAIASSGGEAWPCGICRQVLFEFGEDIKVITGKDEEHLEMLPLKDLLVKGFRLQD